MCSMPSIVALLVLRLPVHIPGEQAGGSEIGWYRNKPNEKSHLWSHTGYERDD